MNEWLYRKNNLEKPCCWRAYLSSDASSITVEYGIVGGNIRIESYAVTQKDANKELQSRYNDKRKQGYVALDDIKDDNGRPPVEDGTDALYSFLSAYLPSYRTNENNGNILPMLAKSYTGKIWSKIPNMIGQWKINGLRCFISAYRTDDIFRSVRLKFQSREGLIWHTLTYLEDYLIDAIPPGFMLSMLNDNWILDGEVYLPGHTVNEINHFVKDPNCKENKLLQFWCYDIAIQDMLQEKRSEIRTHDLGDVIKFADINEHLNNTKQLVILPDYNVYSDNNAVIFRDNFIRLGFEGLILRNPNVDYQYGRRRVGYMEKFKSKTDGKFLIVDIQSEQKRNLPIITCRNDINEETFETRFSYPHAKQEEILRNKKDYIGKYVFITFGERSGITKVPFHIKEVYLL
jgi:hypothetical protein